ncbi:hypothetical protein PFISCL1PPCAC_7136 [Pristionchus fissidentatus]|uniref:Uncharacterized protein n=1 Tax=Pristionchus fissidentatus TaxID=1538716 RepID=A0AAV5VBK1_9BILA|nr:hypothetical protein PFISCL1PPCAC_7136 [Pristionchus fissidentatus]
MMDRKLRISLFLLCPRIANKYRQSDAITFYRNIYDVFHMSSTQSQITLGDLTDKEKKILKHLLPTVVRRIDSNFYDVAHSRWARTIASGAAFLRLEILPVLRGVLSRRGLKETLECLTKFEYYLKCVIFQCYGAMEFPDCLGKWYRYPDDNSDFSPSDHIWWDESCVDSEDMSTKFTEEYRLTD